jgi:DNA-binding transcriptional LysR family regulator
MKLNYFRYFIVLAEELHFGRAASRLAMTQPPLSAAIKSLEEELDVQLLRRNSKLVELTPAGAAFLVEARQILERVTRANSLVKAIGGGMSGRLDIGMSPALIYRETPRIVKQFGLESPGIEVVLHEKPLAEQLENLMHGQLHAGFINGSAIPPQLASLPLKDDVFVLCIPENHPKAANTEIDLKEMADEEFIIFSRAIGPANHDNMIANFSRAGIHPRTVHQGRGWLTIMAMVSRGLGVAIVPSSMARAKMGGVRLIPMPGPSIVAPAALVWNPSLVAPTLLKFLESATRTLETD